MLNVKFRDSCLPGHNKKLIVEENQNVVK
jgi:hypothetical protein